MSRTARPTTVTARAASTADTAALDAAKSRFVALVTDLVDTYGHARADVMAAIKAGGTARGGTLADYIEEARLMVETSAQVRADAAAVRAQEDMAAHGSMAPADVLAALAPERCVEVAETAVEPTDAPVEPDPRLEGLRPGPYAGRKAGDLLILASGEPVTVQGFRTIAGAVCGVGTDVEGRVRILSRYCMAVARLAWGVAPRGVKSAPGEKSSDVPGGVGVVAAADPKTL